jgi:predicted tellurium resistance membrane protein TerC
MDIAISLLTLTAMEIVLGIDNVVFIAILASRLPAEQQSSARKLGLLAALVTRLLLLFSISWFMGLTAPFFHWTDIGVPEAWVHSTVADAPGSVAAIKHDVNGVSVRDLILLVGGLFLIWHSVQEIHHKVEGAEEKKTTGEVATFSGVITRIAVMDIIFSLDSVITAVGMVKHLWVMVVAILLSMVVMILFATRISNFVERHPTIKMLALSFLILIGVLLVAEGFGTPVSKGYVYFAMAFSLGVEMLNLRVRSLASVASDD